jgi:two-component sensor histidine kinase
MNNLIEFIVSDNGVGLPESLNPGSGGFGMQLMEVFLKQLKADLTIDRKAGTTYRIVFQIS